MRQYGIIPKKGSAGESAEKHEGRCAVIYCRRAYGVKGFKVYFSKEDDFHLDSFHNSLRSANHEMDRLEALLTKHSVPFEIYRDPDTD